MTDASTQNEKLKNAVSAAQPTAVAAAPKKPNTLESLLESRKTAMGKVVPKHLSVDRLIRVAVMSVAKTPALGRCEQISVLRSVLQAAEIGLEPSGVIGHAYLVPYGNQCQLIVGYKGMIELARRSGLVKTISAYVVRARDEFKVELGDCPSIKHVPNYSVKDFVGDQAPVIAVYAVATLADCVHQFEVMTVDEIEAIRSRSKAGKSGPWVTDWEEMAKKTVVKRLCKYLPQSAELAKAIVADNATESGKHEEVDQAFDMDIPEAISAEYTEVNNNGNS